MKANNKFFDEARQQLSQANDEFFRPEEDLVTYSVCKNAQFSIENFLKGYLIQNRVDVMVDETLDHLYEKCLSINKNFAKLDLSELQCRSLSFKNRDCSDIPKVSKCLSTANELEALLQQEQDIT